MKPSTLQREIMDGHKKFHSKLNIVKTFLTGRRWSGWHKLYLRYMWNELHKEVERYIPYLERIEQGYYDRNEELMEDKVKDDYTNRKGVFADLRFSGQ